MKRVALLVVLMLIMSATASQAYLELVSNGGSMGWYREITTVPGQVYIIDAIWQGSGTNNWCELLLFNDDGRAIYDQLDAPSQGSIVAKVDGWGMNGGMPFGWGSIENYLFSGGSTQRVATGTKMYIGLKNGASGGTSVCRFDNMFMDPEHSFNLAASEAGWVRWNSPWGSISTMEWNVVVPEPTSIIALVTGLAGFGGLALRRRR